MKGRAATTSGSIIWAGISQSSRVLLQIAALAILSRILPPADFGLIAMASIVTTFASLLRDMGTSAAVIQREDLSAELLDTVFWFNILLGCVLAASVAVLAAPIAALFREPRLIGVLLALTLTFPATSAGAVQQALLERSMRFRTLARIEISSALLALGVAVVAALKGAGVLSLVLNSLTMAISTTAQLWLSSRWRARWGWSAAHFRGLWHFSGNLFGFQVLNYLSRNVDTMLIGRFLGANDIGFYNVGYRIMLFPLANLSAVLSRVLFPVLSRQQDDKVAFGQLYLKTAASISAITAPVMIGLWALRQSFVNVVLGERWLPVAEVLAWFAPVGLIQSVLTTVGLIYMGTGNTRLMRQWGIFAGVATVVAMIIGLQWGYLGVARAYAVVTLLLVYPAFAVPLKLIGLRFKDIVAATWRQIFTACLMACVVMSLEYIPLVHELLDKLPQVWALVLRLSVAATAYLGFASFIIRGTMLDILRALRPAKPQDGLPKPDGGFA